jgi:hypothetical protein
MKVNFKINTLRGIFLCLTRNKDGLCHRTVFRQTRKIKNICLKRRFQFVGRSYKLKTPTLLPGKSPPIFTLRFAPVRPCFTYGRIKTGQSSTTLQKGEHFPLTSSYLTAEKHNVLQLHAGREFLDKLPTKSCFSNY